MQSIQKIVDCLKNRELKKIFFAFSDNTVKWLKSILKGI